MTYKEILNRIPDSEQQSLDTHRVRGEVMLNPSQYQALWRPRNHFTIRAVKFNECIVLCTWLFTEATVVNPERRRRGCSATSVTCSTRTTRRSARARRRRPSSTRRQRPPPAARRRLHDLTATFVKVGFISLYSAMSCSSISLLPRRKNFKINPLGDRNRNEIQKDLLIYVEEDSKLIPQEILVLMKLLCPLRKCGCFKILLFILFKNVHIAYV